MTAIDNKGQESARFARVSCEKEIVEFDGGGDRPNRVVSNDDDDDRAVEQVGHSEAISEERIVPQWKSLNRHSAPSLIPIPPVAHRRPVPGC